MDKRSQGFTLIEVLLVLAVFLSLLSIGFSIPYKLFQQQEASQFLKLFQNDILYLQEMTMNEETAVYLTIDSDTHQYTIRQTGKGKMILKRNIPKTWKVELRHLVQPIAFTDNGTIKNPGSFVIKTDVKAYKIIFPFGKGRSYIEEQ